MGSSRLSHGDFDPILGSLNDLQNKVGHDALKERKNLQIPDMSYSLIS